MFCIDTHVQNRYNDQGFSQLPHHRLLSLDDLKAIYSSKRYCNSSSQVLYSIVLRIIYIVRPLQCWGLVLQYKLFLDSERVMLSEEELLSIEASRRLLNTIDALPITMKGLKREALSNWKEIKKLEEIVFSPSFGSDPMDETVARQLLALYKKDVGVNAQTGLNNRHRFLEDISEQEKQPKDYAIGMLDLVGFGKMLNKLYGVDIGDVYLESIAELLSFFAKNNSIQIGGQPLKISVARTGGDEFHWISQGLPDNTTLESVKNAIQKAFIEPIQSILQDWCDIHSIAYRANIHHTEKLRTPQRNIEIKDRETNELISLPPTAEKILGWVEVEKKPVSAEQKPASKLIVVGRI